MNSKRLRFILLGSLGLLVVGFLMICYLGLSVLSNKSQQMVELKVKSRVLESQLNSIGPAKEEVEKYSYFKEVAKTVIPSDKDQARAVLDITRIANQSGLVLQGITFPTSNLGGRATAATGGSSSATASPSRASVSRALSQAKPVSGIEGLYSLELTITPDVGTGVSPDKQVTYAKMLDFLRRIENNRRTAQITQINIQTQTINSETEGTISDQSINFSLTINIFIKP